MEKNNFFYKLLSHPSVYYFSQYVMSATSFRRKLVRNHVKVYKNTKILDVGCGPADILKNFEKIDYYGFDTNSKYINYAKKKYEEKKPKLFCKRFTKKELKTLPKMDYVLLFGIIHHLNNEEINNLLRLCKNILKKNGKLLVVEPVFLKRQNFIAKMLIKLDRGSNVKSKKNYIILFKKYFNKVFTKVVVQNFIPYTWFIIVCRKNS